MEEHNSLQKKINFYKDKPLQDEIDYWKKTNTSIENTQEKLFADDMGLLKTKVDKDLYDSLVVRWNSGTTAHENILTATWALTKI